MQVEDKLEQVGKLLTIKKLQTESRVAELSTCLQRIEEKLGWGPSAHWTSQDFERLAEAIAQQTAVSLSPTTLKRVWGRIQYRSSPTTLTLNTLAQFIGYESYRDFQLAQTSKLVHQPLPEPLVDKITADRRFSLRNVCLVGGISLLLGSLFWTWRHFTEEAQLSSTRFAFTSSPVTKGLPNSVVFRYDASQSPTDSVYIQQSWDSTRRQLVSRQGHAHTSIYYYPGYYQAKLVVGHQIVRQHELIIPTDRWLIAIRQEPKPLYISPMEAIREGVMHVPLPLIKAKNVPLSPTLPIVTYMNMGHLGRLRNDNFIFETRIKSSNELGVGRCQKSFIVIQCRNDALSIPLSAPGCVGELEGYLAGHTLRAAHEDLSGFGTNLNQWVDVRCVVVNKQIQLWVNGRRVYQTIFPHPASDIIGIEYLFQGSGFVDYCRFLALNGQTVFSDSFTDTLL